MNMKLAMALSNGNKAEAYSNNGGHVIAQSHHESSGDTWIHLWYIQGMHVISEITFYVSDFDADWKDCFQNLGVDPDGEYWKSL